MADVKQVITEMETDEPKKAVARNFDMQIDSDCRSLRRTISAPSVKSGDINDKAPVFVQENKNPSSTLSTTSMITTEIDTDANKTYEQKSPIQRSRSRTYSAGSQVTPMTLNVDCSSTSPSPVSIGSPAPRVIQIRREESVDELTREVAKERDITAAINLSRSWDETSWLNDKTYLLTNDTREKGDSIDDVFSSLHPGISSPVRFIDKLPYNRSLTPSPIGVPISPKQRTYRRSLSPSNLRPSLLTSKRKLDPDDPESLGSPAKRNSLYHSPASTISSSSSNSSPDHLLDVHIARLSGDEDSEHVFITNSITTSATLVNNPLSCDTRPINAFAFVKPRYVAPQSPLAAGVNSSSIHQAHDSSRKASLSNCTSYTFTSVKE
ncbi:uncharacterized protein LOC130636147 [Hydractinia symbiolongicarpus]|uniref:uncharacterized protein LOC130636147 n=1 Tax=Hydractinia symbiolongicarpus TaxID=13093 RepID=UPI0025500955|nr:uncharacterized protein LOC130636147 [Hydractinia symbiolongicarpus]